MRFNHSRDVTRLERPRLALEDLRELMVIDERPTCSSCYGAS
jgi:hypothetical protein